MGKIWIFRNKILIEFSILFIMISVCRAHSGIHQINKRKVFHYKRIFTCFSFSSFNLNFHAKSVLLSSPLENRNLSDTKYKYRLIKKNTRFSKALRVECASYPTYLISWPFQEPTEKGSSCMRWRQRWKEMV